MHARKGLLLLGIMVLLVAVGSLTAVGSASFGSRPTELSTEEGIYNTYLYTTDFNHIDDFLINTITKF